MFEELKKKTDEVTEKITSIKEVLDKLEDLQEELNYKLQDMAEKMNLCKDCFKPLEDSEEEYCTACLKKSQNDLDDILEAQNGQY